MIKMSEVVSLRRTPDDNCRTGAVCSWDFYDDDTDDEVHVYGQLLGYASSKWQNHNHTSTLAVTHTRHPAYKPCSACRWFEVRIIKLMPEPEQPAVPPPTYDTVELKTPMPSVTEYAVSFIGRSAVSGEVDRHSLVITPSAYKIIEVLTQMRQGQQFIPRVSRLALAEAAGLDAGIEAAWIERPT